MPKVPQAHLDARRREILVAAHRTFAAHGFRNATMQQIADETGLSVGALYRYFDGKEALVEALAEWGRAQKRDVLEAAGSGAEAGGLGALMTRLMELLPATREALPTVRFDVRLWGEALGDPHLQRFVAANLKELRDTIADHIREQQAGERIRADADPDIVARALVSLLAGLELQLAFEPRLDRGSYEEVVRHLLGALEA